MEWLSVKDRGIPENQRFIIFGNHNLHPGDPKQCYIGVYKNDQWYSMGQKIVNVTHYKQLPELPSK